MNTFFPSLLEYGQIGPFIIRVVLGVTLAYFGYVKVIRKGTSSGSNTVRYGYLEIFVALFLIVGLYTQLAALINVIIVVIKLIYKGEENKLLTNGINYYILLLAMALSLLFTGPGILALSAVMTV